MTDVYNEVNKAIERLFGDRAVRVGTHTDLDGLVSLFNFSCKWDIEDYYFAPYFGSTTSTDKTIVADVMLDMVPDNKNYEGLVIDHHPNHPLKHKYTLVLDNVPASLMVYYATRDALLDEDKWKTVIGVVGDGRPELIPIEIWDEYPELYKEEIATIRDYRSGTYVNSYPLWTQLTSRVAAALRIKKYTIAFDVLMKAQTPYDIFYNKELDEMREAVNTEVKRVKDEYRPIRIGHIIYLEYESEYVIESILASTIESKQKCPIIVLNKNTQSASIRGAQATWLVSKLREKGFIAGGHPGYAGLQLKDKTISDLKKALREIAY